jgi:hypothetical protein
MVNFKAIIYIHNNTDISHFPSMSQYRTWRLSRCSDEAEKTQLSQYYNITARRGEQYLEEKYGLTPGTMGGIHHIFNTTARAENYLKDQGLLNAFSSNHFVVLETCPSRRYTAITIYTETGHLAITVNFKEPTVQVNLGSGLSDLPSLYSRE